jgi:hypothetical protein
MSKYRIALTRENQKALAISANVNGRSLVKQLNHILGDHFKADGTTQPAASARKP